MRSSSGPGDARLVLVAAGGSPLAGVAGLAGVAAAAGVHGRHQLDARGVGDAVVGPGDDGLAGLQRLAQAVEHGRVELGQLVEEQDAAVGERHLAGSGAQAAADQGRHAGRMMGAAERAFAAELAAGQLAGDRGDLADLEQFHRLQRRQDRRQARGEHGFARAGWADHQQVVAAGGRHFQRALGAFLALDVGEVGAGPRLLLHRRDGAGQHLRALEVVDEAEDMRARDKRDVGRRPGGFRPRGLRADQALAHGVGADRRG